MEQDIIDIAVAIATKHALAGYPVRQIVWYPPRNTSDPEGFFGIIPYEGSSITETPPWGL